MTVQQARHGKPKDKRTGAGAPYVFYFIAYALTSVADNRSTGNADSEREFRLARVRLGGPCSANERCSIYGERVCEEFIYDGQAPGIRGRESKTVRSTILDMTTEVQFEEAWSVGVGVIC